MNLKESLRSGLLGTSASHGLLYSRPELPSNGERRWLLRRASDPVILKVHSKHSNSVLSGGGPGSAPSEQGTEQEETASGYARGGSG